MKIHRKKTLLFHDRLFFQLVIILVYFLSSCSSISYSSSPSTYTPDPKRSGYELLNYAEQYRNLSSVMNRKYLEQDIESIQNLLIEALEIPETVKNLEVSNAYLNAKEYVLNWMWSDAYWFTLIAYDGTTDEMSKAFDDSTKYLTLFLDEMLRLGHDLD